MDNRNTNTSKNMGKVHYQPKLITALQNPTTKQLYNNSFDNNPGKFYKKLSAIAGKQQVEWLKDVVKRHQPKSLKDLIMAVTTEMSYTVEINISKMYFGKYSEIEPYNTAHFDYYNVPGGFNYVENEISTPGIVPAIREFNSNHNIIGSFRSDDVDYHLCESIAPTYIRRILEFKSELFQQRPKWNYLTCIYDKDYNGDMGSNEMYSTKYDLEGDNETRFLKLLLKDNNWVTFFVKAIIQNSVQNGYESIRFPTGETAARIQDHRTMAEEIKEIENDIFTLQFLGITEEVGRLTDSKDILKEFEDENERNSEYRFVANYKIGDAMKSRYFNSKEKAEKHLLDEVSKLEVKKAELIAKGIRKIKPIENFYETHVQNVLNKLHKGAIERITDGYGNDWFQITQPVYNLISF